MNVYYVAMDVRSIVLVEGESDRVALDTLAARLGRDLDGEGVRVVPMGGAHAIGRHLARYDGDVRLAGLCDAGEAWGFQRGLERAGFGSDLTTAEMEALGFFVCDADLEDELIRSLGPAAVEAVIDAEHDLASLRTFQNQPFQRDRPIEAQLRRFIGTKSGRKIQYARALVDALDLGRVPPPLVGLLAYISPR